MAEAARQPVATYESSRNGWDDETVNTIVNGWNAGKSASQLSTLTGRSRNAIIGKLTRLRKKGVHLIEHVIDHRSIANQNPKQRRPLRNKGSAKRRSPNHTLIASGATPELMARAKALVGEEIFADLKDHHREPGSGVAPQDLENHHCRWPIGDPSKKEFRHCGKQKAPGLSYCPSCARHAYPQLTPLQLTAMTLMAKEMEDARKRGGPSPYRDTRQATTDFQESLNLDKVSTA